MEWAWRDLSVGYRVGISLSTYLLLYTGTYIII